MKVTNISNYRKQRENVWFEPGETKEVEISKEVFEDRFFTVEEDDNEIVDDDGETQKSEEKNEEVNN